jgi:hypothetical protein
VGSAGDWTWFIGEGTHMNIGGWTALEFFQEHRILSNEHNFDTWNGWNNGIWSWQDGYRRYMIGGNSGDCGSDFATTRWGYSWNNEGDCSSNDVGGGIGMKSREYSAGDAFGCCGGASRRNNWMRVEVYGR